jgi:hypothetical protein
MACVFVTRLLYFTRLLCQTVIGAGNHEIEFRHVACMSALFLELLFYTHKLLAEQNKIVNNIYIYLGPLSDYVFAFLFLMK